jgi:AcrR family transcriptional regulator
VTTTEQRDYGGVSAATRKATRRAQLLDAGLELIGTQGMPGLTVRGALARAQLAPRYFYESFPNTDALAVAVFEQVVAEMTHVGLTAIAESHQSLRTQIHAGLAAVARLLTDDCRKGRVILIESMASPVLAPLRHQAIGTIAHLVAEQAGQVHADHPTDPATLEITARFLVGGFAETLSTVIQDANHHGRDTIVDRCTDLFLDADIAVRRAQRR